MSNIYNHQRGLTQFPPVRTIVEYAQLIGTCEQHRKIASRLATEQAKLRRAKLAERWIVFTVALLLTITMLPALLVIGGILLARALWRRSRLCRVERRLPNAARLL